jgi:hypothetical protein
MGKLGFRALALDSGKIRPSRHPSKQRKNPARERPRVPQILFSLEKAKEASPSGSARDTQH